MEYALEEYLDDGAGMREDIADDGAFVLNDGLDFVAEIEKTWFGTKGFSIGVRQFLQSTISSDHSNPNTNHWSIASDFEIPTFHGR